MLWSFQLSINANLSWLPTTRAKHAINLIVAKDSNLFKVNFSNWLLSMMYGQHALSYVHMFVLRCTTQITWNLSHVQLLSNVRRCTIQISNITNHRIWFPLAASFAGQVKFNIQPLSLLTNLKNESFSSKTIYVGKW